MANECIPLFTPGAAVTGRATAAVTGKRFVGVSAAADPSNGTLIGVAPTSAGSKPFGVASRDAASGTNVMVETRPGVIVPVTCSAAITAGAEVEATATGQAITRNTGVAAGVAVSTTASANTDVFVKLY